MGEGINQLVPNLARTFRWIDLFYFTTCQDSLLPATGWFIAPFFQIWYSNISSKEDSELTWRNEWIIIRSDSMKHIRYNPPSAPSCGFCEPCFNNPIGGPTSVARRREVCISIAAHFYPPHPRTPPQHFHSRRRPPLSLSLCLSPVTASPIPPSLSVCLWSWWWWVGEQRGGREGTQWCNAGARHRSGLTNRSSGGREGSGRLREAEASLV